MERDREGEDNMIVLEEEEKITFGVSHIIVTFFATLIGSILGFYLANIW
ncbi:MAG: hypothetical protein HY279_10465 [Nitrospinae bacterium]|nr:hypothetical protein [Nitrospinota bacterium]